MCGIAGIMRWDGGSAEPDALQRMNDAQAHRGPDDEGICASGPIGLGHRRLAILDLSAAGHQPMTCDDGRFVITYNGEVYNFRELRSELEKAGRTFRSTSDTEVVLQAYAQWGPAAVERFNGMFALAIWDARENELFLARDRYGVKPLYCAQTPRGLVFASEIKAILAEGTVRAKMDLPGLLEYMTFQNFFTDRTLFDGVRLFPAGSYVTVRRGATSMPRPVRYWDYHFVSPDSPADEREYLDELDRLLQQAVARQLVSDVEVGAYLSGGMDSGSLTALAARQLPYIKSFTCGFDLSSASGIELGYDERASAEFMSYVYKTEHYEMVLKAGDMERVLPRLAWHLEEPRVGQSYPNFYVARLAGKFVKVCLSGCGGDELFGGYPWRYYRAVVNADFEDYIDKYYRFWQRLIPNRQIRRVFAPVWNEVRDVWTRDIFRDVFAEHADKLTRPEDYVNHSLYFECKTFLHGLLVVEDKLSMAHALEVRVPFLDNDLVDFAMKIPVRMKLGNLGEVIRRNENNPGYKTEQYYLRTRDGKLLLRKAMEKYIPERILRNSKQGFSAPDASWFRGESIDYVRRRLFESDARIYQFMDRQSVQELVNEHMEGKENRRLLIWSLLNLEQWCDTFLDGTGGA